MNPLVTIAIPTYSRLEYLREAVASAQSQSYPAIEILIGDDGTTQEIPKWCEEAAGKDSRIRYQKNSRTLGLAGNWNACAQSARGEFITIIGDDDRLLPEFASKLVGVIDGTNVAFSNHHLIDSSGNRLEQKTVEHTKSYHRDRISAGKLANPEFWVWKNSVPMSASLIRREDVQKLRFREELNTPEIEFFLRLARTGGKFVFLPDYLSEYRVHAHSATGAGLNSEALADCLLPMKATGEAEQARREFMSPLLADAVGRCLLRGEVARARDYIETSYYHAKGAKAEFQKICAALPPVLARTVYRLGKRVGTHGPK